MANMKFVQRLFRSSSPGMLSMARQAVHLAMSATVLERRLAPRECSWFHLGGSFARRNNAARLPTNLPDSAYVYRHGYLIARHVEPHRGADATYVSRVERVRAERR